ncbi:MAG TPA: ATP-binding cassette domain-containing protein [Acidimicrobiales bacterium]|nr:ATP-binding cassette domain-containing protein [Acidimicrobiales bacterium]
MANLMDPFAEIKREVDVYLEVNDIAVVFGGVRAVDGVSIEFKGGAVNGLIGPNGAGKTSLLQVIAGSVHPAAGQVLLDNRNITRFGPARRASHGLIRTFQTAKVFGRLSVIDNLLVGLQNQTGDKLSAALFRRRAWKQEEELAREYAMGLLRDFNMENQAHVRAAELSGGQRRIVEYLRSLMAKPRVLLLDEPTVGLAPWVTERLLHDLRRLREQGLCIVIVEHEMELIRAICDVVNVMASGKVIASGNFDEVARNRDVQDAYLGNQ